MEFMYSFLILVLSITFCYAQSWTKSKPMSNFIHIKPNLEVNKTTSYWNYSTNYMYVDLPFSPSITMDKTPGYLAWAYADFDKDGIPEITSGNKTDNLEWINEKGVFRNSK